MSVFFVRMQFDGIVGIIRVGCVCIWIETCLTG